MNWLGNFFRSKTSIQEEKSLVLDKSVQTTIEEKTLVPQNSSLIAGSKFSIPEPTRSLIFVTDESPQKIQGPFTINITINLSSGETKTEHDEGNLFAEPSLIWTRLPVEPNGNLETSPMYYPSYNQLGPRERYQYLNWLQDVTGPTNLSYVFLYYYGLERHLLIGNYDKAVDEILRLIKFHDRDKFRFYVMTPLIVASLYKKRIDLFDRAPFLLKEVTNEALIMRALRRTPLVADDLVAMSSRVGFTNKRYIKLEPDLFKSILQKKIDIDENIGGPILERFDITQLSSEERSVFCNISIPEKMRTIKIPELLTDKIFQETIYELLSDTHSEIRKIKGLSPKPTPRVKKRWARRKK